MKKIPLLFVFIYTLCSVKAQTPVTETTLDNAKNSIVGSYKLTRIAQKEYDTDTFLNDDAFIVKIKQLTFAARFENGDTLTQEDSLFIEKSAKNDVTYFYSMTYVFNKDKTYTFTFVDNDKVEEVKGTYTYNAAFGMVAISNLKNPDISFVYNKEKQTLQNFNANADDLSTKIVFSKIDIK